MDRGTADEFDASLLGSRVPAGARLLRSVELLAYLSSWMMLVAAIILDGSADGFSPQKAAGDRKSVV